MTANADICFSRILVFQLCLGRIATTIVYEYSEAALCPLDPRLNRRKTVITIFQSIQTTIAVIAVIAYERRMKQHLRDIERLPSCSHSS